jgi:hypothetical protein
MLCLWQICMIKFAWIINSLWLPIVLFNDIKCWVSWRRETDRQTDLMTMRIDIIPRVLLSGFKRLVLHVTLSQYIVCYQPHSNTLWENYILKFILLCSASNPKCPYGSHAFNDVGHFICWESSEKDFSTTVLLPFDLSWFC